jgi:hypothetical protein
MARHVIARCTNGKILRYKINEDDHRIRLGGVGFREMARVVETVEDAENILKISRFLKNAAVRQQSTPLAATM